MQLFRFRMLDQIHSRFSLPTTANALLLLILFTRTFFIKKNWADCRTLSGQLPWEATPADQTEGIIIYWKLEWLLMFQESLRYTDLNSGPKFGAFLARILRSVGFFHKLVRDACILIRPADICQGRAALNGC